MMAADNDDDEEDVVDRVMMIMMMMMMIIIIIISKVGWVWSSRIGLLLLTVTDVSTTYAVVILTLEMTTAQVVETSVTVTFTWTIKLNLLLKWLLGSNLSHFYYCYYERQSIKITIWINWFIKLHKITVSDGSVCLHSQWTFQPLDTSRKKGKRRQVLGHVNGENVPIQTGLWFAMM